MKKICKSGNYTISVIHLALIILTFISESSTSTTTTSKNNDESIKKTIESRSLLSDMAGQLLSRTGTNSQVLSLNLTNLIILLILKGLLFGAAFVGSGTWKGRSLENNINENIFQSDTSLISESELLLLISYLIGETTDNYDCLKRVACNETKKATQYIVASKMFIGSAKLLKNIVPINKKYEELIGDLQHAINFGKSGGKCEERYYCTNNNNINNNIKN